MIKLIATDMDGTLINDKGEISQSIFEIIDILSKKNIRFMAASGRFFNQLSKNFEGSNNEIIFAAHNGAIVQYNNSDDILYESDINPDSYGNLIELSRKENIDMFFCTKNCAYGENPSNKLASSLRYHNIKYLRIEDLYKIQDSVLKITIFEGTGIKKGTIEKVKASLTDDLDIIVSGRQWADVVNKGTNKGKAIKLIQQKYNIKPEETMVFGDHYNDLSMFEGDHQSYAMENAVEEIKKLAKFIAKSNNDDGVIKVIKEEILDNKAYWA
jgi:Cof subfamily protein (haloacid dehalogenase superfamily)